MFLIENYKCTILIHDALILQEYGEIVKRVSTKMKSVVSRLTILLVQVSYITENSYSCTNIVKKKLVSTSIVLN